MQFVYMCINSCNGKHFDITKINVPIDLVQLIVSPFVERYCRNFNKLTDGRHVLSFWAQE